MFGPLSVATNLACDNSFIVILLVSHNKWQHTPTFSDFREANVSVKSASLFLLCGGLCNPEDGDDISVDFQHGVICQKTNLFNNSSV
jgi:hypothetical protein